MAYGAHGTHKGGSGRMRHAVYNDVCTDVFAHNRLQDKTARKKKYQKKRASHERAYETHLSHVACVSCAAAVANTALRV